MCEQDRIVEMTLDKEYEVAVQAVKLVISVLRSVGFILISVFFFELSIPKPDVCWFYLLY